MGGDTNLNGASPFVHHLVDAHLEYLSVPQGSAAQHHAMIEVIGGTEGTASGDSDPQRKLRTCPSQPGKRQTQKAPPSCPGQPRPDSLYLPLLTPSPNPVRAPSAGFSPPLGPYWGLRAVRPSWVMAAFCPQLGWKSSRSGSAWAAGAARRRAPSGDSARRMALFLRRRSLWLLLWTMVTFTAIPYKSTTPYTTGGVNGVATPVGVEGTGMGGKERRVKYRDGESRGRRMRYRPPPGAPACQPSGFP